MVIVLTHFNTQTEIAVLYLWFLFDKHATTLKKKYKISCLDAFEGTTCTCDFISLKKYFSTNLPNVFKCIPNASDPGNYVD